MLNCLRTSAITVALAMAGLLMLRQQTWAVLFDATGDASYHTNAPTGALTNSGWQYEGQFDVFLGTAIAPHYFLTAKHIGGATNWDFVLDGASYHPVAWFDDPAPGSDLRLWRVAERLPRYAPVYTGSREAGKPILVIGRGTQRGAPVTTDNGFTTNGWYWGTSDNVMRWGSNTVEAIVTNDGAPYLAATFDHGAGPDECHISGGDSGGASFVLADGVWQLAGIHYAVEGPFSTNTTDAGFDAAVYDMFGLYHYSKSLGAWIPYATHDPSSFISSRVSAHYDWITNTIPDFDSNTNGIPDWWELQYSGSIHGLPADGDTDLDGQSNLAEWIARTDPTHAASRFGITAINWSNNLVALSFQGWTDRLYRVEVSDALSSNAAWHTASSNDFAGNGGTTTWSDINQTATVTSRFYRLNALLPP